MNLKDFIPVITLGVIAVQSVYGEKIALTGATVHTISGAPIPDGVVIFENETIVDAGTSVFTGDAQVIDLAGMNLYPGLIDAASILGLDEISAVRATVDSREVGAFTPEVAAWVSINPDSELIPVARANGIAYSHVLPGGGVLCGQSGLIQSDGWTIENMAFEKSLGLVVSWPGMSLNTNPNHKKSLKELDKERKKRIRELNDFFDEAEAYVRAREAGSQSVDRVPSWEAMGPFVRGEKPVFVNASDTRQIRRAIQWATKRGLDLVIVGGRDAASMADEIANAEVPVIFDSVFSVPGTIEDAYDQQYSTPAILSAAGVQIAFGVTGWRGDAASQSRNLPYDAAQAVAYGLSREVALRALTLDAARILGVDDKLGSIEKGKVATLIAVDGDILDIRSSVKRMWIGGQEVSLESRHTRLNKKYRSRPRE